MHTFAKKPKATQQTTSAKSPKPSQSFVGQSRDLHSILQLQRTIGNQAVLSLLQTAKENVDASSTNSASTGFAHDFSQIPVQAAPLSNIQPKLKVNAPGDQYEQEADRVADQVLRQKMPEEEEEKVEIQARTSQQAVGGEREVIEELENRLIRSKGGGNPISDQVRAFVEPRMQFDFSKVRVHTDNEAARMNQELGARVFTHHEDIYFGIGQYSPQSNQGRRLLVHELTHVVQQESGRAGSAGDTVIQRDDGATRPRRLRLEPSYTELLAESQQRTDALRRWLETNHITVSLSSMTSIIRAVRRDVPEAENLSNPEIVAFVRSWAEARHLPLSRVGPTEAPSPPSLTLIELPEWLSLYSASRIGFHVTLNPGTESPLPARITSHFRERGLPVTSELLSELLHNREVGIASLEALLRRILPAEFGNDILGIAAYVADELMDATLEAHVQRERPTPSERWEERDARIRQVFGGSESAEIGPIQEFIEDLSAGVSLTVHF